MTSALLLLAATVLALAGCTLLALGLPQNWKAVTGKPLGPRAKAAARRWGWAAVLAALPPCILRDGPGFAALSWPLLFAAAAFAVAMALSFRPALLQPAARVLPSETKPRPD